MQTFNPTILFYPTSPVHVSDLQLVLDKLPGWRVRAAVYRPFAAIAPGIARALREAAIEYCELDSEANLDCELPNETSILVLGAVCGTIALDLIAWAKARRLAVVAIEEVAQLALNQLDINNYDAPLDRLWVASAEEKRLFKALGYSAAALSVSGLLANDRFPQPAIAPEGRAIVYTTSPLRSRQAIQNKDNWEFRRRVLQQIAQVAQRTGREVIVKLHPNEKPERERGVICEIIPDAFVIGMEQGMDEIFRRAAVLVNRGNSQTCLESVLRGIPTVVAAGGLRTLFHEDGGAYVVDDIDALAGVIERALANHTPDTTGVRCKHSHCPKPGVAAAIARELSDIASQEWPAKETTWNWLIKSYLSLGQHERALRHCEEQELNTVWQKQVGAALRAHSQASRENSIDGWLACSIVDPGWFFPHYELAHNHAALGNHKAALHHARQAIALHPPYHKLWHELPMRVVVMQALRSMGDLAGAAAELAPLERGGLLEVVPELQIEAAAQQCIENHGLECAERHIETALTQLKQFPLERFVDQELRSRALDQQLEIAGRFLALRQTAESERCLERTRAWVAQDADLAASVSRRSCEIGARWESDGASLGESRFYEFARQLNSHDPWPDVRLAVLALKQDHFPLAVKAISRAAEKPNALKQALAQVASKTALARLARYWTFSPRSIVKPCKLLALVSAWLLLRLFGKPPNSRCDALAVTLLVWRTVAQHFGNRLRTAWLSLTMIYESLRYSVSQTLPASSSRRHCPICGGAGAFEYRNAASLLLRCRNCAHVYACDLPDDRKLAELYGDFSYREKDLVHQGITSLEESPQWSTYLDARIGILERLGLLARVGQRTPTVFEIGCAEGMVLHTLKKRGMEVAGCEMNRAVATQGMKKLGIKIHTDPFENLGFPNHQYDLVMSFHTLEHMRFPVQVIEKIAGMLRPEGALLIEVPCSENEYDNTDHLHFFSEPSLRNLLDRCFFEIEIVPNQYTTSAGVACGSIYGVGRRPRRAQETAAPIAERSLAPSPIARPSETAAL